ncbi:hypothetical protein MMC31_003986 [Peltigera leucophlebia]|nr:hypothetical protein [Peltigera leucophlebia]
MSPPSANTIEGLAALQTVQHYDAFRIFSRHSPSITPRPTSTPPPHPESEYIEEASSHEEQAHRALVEDGCPTCYPTGLEFPLQKIPDEYRRIVSYWESLSATGDVDKARNRRRRYGFKGDVSLTSDPGEQSDLENWIESQSYQLEIDEGLAKKIKDDREKLDAEVQQEEVGDRRSSA